MNGFIRARPYPIQGVFVVAKTFAKINGAKKIDNNSGRAVGIAACPGEYVYSLYKVAWLGVGV